MKKLFIFFAFLFLLLPYAYPQQNAKPVTPNLKYGKPSAEELNMTDYAPDTTATAVCLFHLGETYFTYNSGFKLVTEHTVRLKILKPQGVDYANVWVPYYSPAKTDEGKERADEIEGCSYNMENGKCVKTPLKRDLVVIERINNQSKLLKFSLPAVKAGTVIEYHYKLYSDYFVQIDNWKMQDEIPMLYNQYKITIPNVFIYNIELRGKDHIQIKERESSIHGRTGGQDLQPAQDFTMRCREITFTSRNLPAIRQDETFCWCPEDYKIQISFDLQGVQFPGEEYKSYSKSWEDVDKELTKSDDEQFGKHLAFTNPYREDTRQLLLKDMNFEQRIIQSFLLLKKKLAWDGKYRIYSKNLTKVVKAGSGSNADLNFIWMGILKDFGLQAYPVVLSRRSLGVLPFSFPSLQKLNTFVLAIYEPEKQRYVFLDSSMDIPAFNVLPPDLCVTKARLLSPHETEEKKWVNLMDISNNAIRMRVSATLNPDGIIQGQRISTFQGQEAVDYQKKHFKKPDAPSDTDHPADDFGKRLIISPIKINDTSDNPGRIEEEAEFSMPVDNTGNRFYINPMIFPHLTKNPFIQAERVLPVEFSYPYSFKLSCVLTIPEGYEVEELPQSQLIKTEGEKLQCKYMIQQQGKIISLNYLFSLKEYLFSPELYPQLQEAWAKIIEKNQALIVLKKI